MTGELIKSFLVGLGFEVDSASLSKFNKSIASASVRVAGLATAITGAATAITYGISEISEGFEKMGYEYRLIAPAINKTLLLRQALLQAYSAAGVNIYKVIQQSIKLNLSLTKTKFAFQALYQGVAARFFPLLTKQSDMFRQKLYANMPKIQAALERFIKFVFKALEAVTQLGTRAWSILLRVYEFFRKLHDATEGWSTIILGVIAAWNLLNLSFLATPLGQLLAGLLAILALYDDFKTFQEGGNSFFNWTNAIPVINAVEKALMSVRDQIGLIFDVAFNLVDIFIKLFHLDFAGAFEGFKNILHDIFDSFKNIWEIAKNFVGVGGAIGGAVSNLINGTTGGNVAANLQNNPVGAGVNPLGAQAAQSNSQSTSLQLQQQTNINVNGAADAQAAGKAVASEQNRVNQNQVRYLKSSTQ